ncbi:MAG TPA: sugar transferase [Burkholderiales bacterium]|jgi:sugar transferase EpsL|nr:sugar transferase [Burkholderiales bacterium]
MFSYSTTGKRLLDICLSAAGLAFTLPLIVAVALVIRTTLGSPMLFTQVRPGRHGRPFILYKFRSMSDARAPDGELLGDEARLTAVGHWLRKLSLDELPQLWNVLKGDMSLVGPRPLLMEYLPLYSARQARRHEVRPGITGWAQVNGRNAVSWEERFDLDLWYVERVSLTLDLRILSMTVLRVVRPHGISQPGSATMTKFTGTGRNE